MTVQKGGWDYFNEGWTTDSSGNPAGNVAGSIDVDNITAKQPFFEVVYSGTTVETVDTSALEDYTDWVFQVEGALAAEDITIEISNDGTTFYAPDIISQYGTAIAQDAANIEADGIYCFNSLTLGDGFKGFGHLRINRKTATAAATVTVTAWARPAGV